MNRVETAERLELDLNAFSADEALVREYSRGYSEHRYGVLCALSKKAETGDVKALVFLAERHLGRTEASAEDERLQQFRHLLALSPEQRRQRIRELSQKLEIK